MANNREQQRKRAAELMTSRTKKNSYTKGAKRGYFFGYPDNTPGNTTQKGFSDCSSAVRKAILAATGIDIGSNTHKQINNRKKGIIVDETSGYYPDKSKLKYGDCLYFKGNKNHSLSVGHVEMYIGDGKLSGHGSGTGPRTIDMMKFCKGRATSSRRYFMTIRWIGDDGEEGGTVILPVMKDGSYGEDVKDFQLDLIALGFNLGPYGADGDFGPHTEKAVRAFQVKYGMPETGEVDKAMLKKIEELLEDEGDTDDDDEEAPVVEQPIIDPGKALTVKDGRWNIRTGPGTNYPVAAVVRGGDVLEIADLDGWTPIKVNGELLFIGPAAIKK